ncbi:hypothetical protein KY289_030546 [Solanum tuberosum]|nr:hypothetical protein KY289_030546 [Solanum tuberosum]
MEKLSLNSSKANLVESSGTVVKDRFKSEQKKVSKNEHMKKKNQFNKPESAIHKFKGPCFVCGKDSKQEGQSDAQAHLTEGNEVIANVVVEGNLLANKTHSVLDTSSSMHFCTNKNSFHDFEESTDGESVYMGNSTSAGVMSKGKVLLK